MTTQAPQNAYLVAYGTGSTNPTVVFTRAPTPNDFVGPNGQTYMVGQRWIYNGGASSATITAITQANPCVITAANTFQVGQIVYIQSVAGMTQLNGNYYEITAVNEATITINVDSTSFTAYTSGGKATVTVLYEYVFLGIVTKNGYAQANWNLLSSEPLNAGQIEALEGDDGGIAYPSSLGVITISGGTTGLTTTASSHTVDLTGTLDIANGGTASTSFNTNGSVISGSTSTSALTALSLTDGQIVIGSSAGAPAAATINAGYGISVSNSSNSITISSTGSEQTWTDESTNFNAAVGNGYFITGTATATLPASPSQGNLIEFHVEIGGALTIQANTGQVINISSAQTVSGGTAVNNGTGDAVTLVYRSANSNWNATSVIGTWTLT